MTVMIVGVVEMEKSGGGRTTRTETVVERKSPPLVPEIVAV